MRNADLIATMKANVRALPDDEVVKELAIGRSAAYGPMADPSRLWARVLTLEVSRRGLDSWLSG